MYFSIKRAFLLALALPSFLSAARAADPFTGTWKINGAKTLTGQVYTGTVNIQAAGNVYNLHWNTTIGEYAGVALAIQDRLCVAWGGQGCGTMLYKVGADGTLDGRWTVPGATSLGTEKATGGKPGELTGEYSIKGTNPDGKGSYAGKLKIKKSGEVYQVEWTLPNAQPYYGVGILSDDLLQVGWSTDQNMYAALVYTFNGAAARGLWTVKGASALAHEDLTK